MFLDAGAVNIITVHWTAPRRHGACSLGWKEHGCNIPCDETESSCDEGQGELQEGA